MNLEPLACESSTFYSLPPALGKGSSGLLILVLGHDTHTLLLFTGLPTGRCHPSSWQMRLISHCLLPTSRAPSLRQEEGKGYRTLEQVTKSGIRGTVILELPSTPHCTSQTLILKHRSGNCGEKPWRQDRGSYRYLEHKHLPTEHRHCIKVPIADVWAVLVWVAWAGGLVWFARRGWSRRLGTWLSGYHSREGFGGLRLSPWRT